MENTKSYQRKGKEYPKPRSIDKLLFRTGGLTSFRVVRKYCGRSQKKNKGRQNQGKHNDIVLWRLTH